jgi:two-component system, LytTR family, sensor kinase
MPDSANAGPKRLSGKILLIAWFVYATYMAVASYVVSARLGRPVGWPRAIAGDFSYAALWYLLTPLVLLLARRFPFERGKIWTRAAFHLTASIVLAVIHKALHNLVMAGYAAVAEGAPFTWDLQARSIWAFFDYGIQLYWILLLLHHAFDYYVLYQDRKVKAAQLEAQLAQAQLQALRMQLQPHFLFNTLNAISVLIQKDPALARTTLGRLSDLLRTTLDHVGVQQVTLREELEFLGRYLQIEQTRFGDRLTVEVSAGAEVMDALVPNMILQPLVENAIKHGITQQRGPARIAINAWRRDGMLQLRVCDNGEGFDSRPGETHDGIGLATTRERLRKMYGDRQAFELRAGAEGGAEATVTLPYETVTTREGQA